MISDAWLLQDLTNTLTPLQKCTPLNLCESFANSGAFQVDAGYLLKIQHEPIYWRR